MEGSLTPPVARAHAGERTMRRYVGIWACSLLGMLVAVAALCAAVDPYMVLGTPALPGLTLDKPAAADWPRLAKTYTVIRAHPRTILLGGSTVDVGFDPESALWSPAERPVFNFGIDGATPRVHARYLQQALAHGQPTHVVLGVSFTDSLVTAPKPSSAGPREPEVDDEGRLSAREDGTPNPEAWRAYAKDLLFATLSLQAVGDSITTLLSQNSRFTAYETDLGWNNGGAFRRWAAHDGFGGLFANKESSKITQLVRWRTDKRQDVDGVARIIRLARARSVSVTVIILPNHVDLQEAIAQLGLQDDVARWKSDMLTGIVAASCGTATPVWDFSGISPYTTETVPALGDTATRLHWFFEPVHFQPALADLMLARVLRRPGAAAFGHLITPADLAEDARAQRRDLAAWEAQNPDAVHRIRAQLASAGVAQ